MKVFELFYILVLIIAEVSSLFLVYDAFKVMKEAKADGKITKDEIKKMCLTSFIAISCGLAIILSLLVTAGVIKF